jgi:hypothetical protein
LDEDCARYAEHCLKMVPTITDQEPRRIQREMATEWRRLADAIRQPRRLANANGMTAGRLGTKRGGLR